MKTTTEMQLVPIAKLVPYVNNARTHSPEQITKLRSSLREFGFINPVIIDRDFNVIAGHGRILAAKEEGIEEVPCVFADHLTEAQKKAYIIADNRMAMDAGWDEELLRVEIESLQGMDFDPLLTGFDEKELADLFADDSGSEARDDDFDLTAALEKASFVERGDVWTIGRHRLVCGDATSAEDVALLMDGRKANLIVTDPPYGVSFKSASGLTIQNDSMKDEEFYNFLLSAFKCMAEHLEKGGAAYVFHADTEGLNFRKAFIDAGFHLAGVCIWVKNSLVLGRSDYQWQHEPILYVYKVRTVTDTRDTDGSAVTEVYAEAEFYDLTFSVRKEERTFEAEYPETAMAYALEGTEWSVGTVTVRTQRTWTSTEKNALSILRNVANLHGGDLVFDCPNRLVHLLSVNGKDSGALFAYKKNMKSIQRVVDTRELVTRLYAVGAEGMTFADINGGKPYVEDFTYTSEIRISTLDCSSFTNPYQMKEYAEMRLAQYAKPTISYVLNAMDLSVLTGYEHEAWELGDYVRVEDKELGLSVATRIVRREYNLQEPWNTVLELSTTLKNLGSSASEWDNAADSLEGTSMVSNNDIREMVPFNLLRNSRADDGLAYWVSSGFEADSENGASGTASFKAEGVAGMTKSLSQTVYPANRSSYTLSAQIGSENLEKLSEDSQVGIEVVIEYEDGSTESRFIDLY